MAFVFHKEGRAVVQAGFFQLVSRKEPACFPSPKLEFDFTDERQAAAGHLDGVGAAEGGGQCDGVTLYIYIRGEHHFAILVLQDYGGADGVASALGSEGLLRAFRQAVAAITISRPSSKCMVRLGFIVQG